MVRSTVKHGRWRTILGAAALGALLAGASAAPAMADGWGHGGDHRGGWGREGGGWGGREGGWGREGGGWGGGGWGWGGHEWLEHHPYAYGGYGPPAYYAPPPPPVYYGGPAYYPGSLNVTIPFQ